MARRFNRLVSIVLSASLFVLSAGLDAQQAFAQTFTGRSASVTSAPQLTLGVLGAPLPSMSLPAVSLNAAMLPSPSAALSAPLLASPVAAVALAPVTPVAAISAQILAAAPALQALSKPETVASAASAAGRDLENVLTGAKSAATGDVSEAVAGAPSALTQSLPAASAAPDAPKAPEVPEVPAAEPAPFKSISSASSYSVHRLALKAVAVLTGAVFTLPQAGPALTAKIIASAADKALVLSDFDDTLAGYNEILPAAKVNAIRAIRAAGKQFAVISDRGDVKRPGQIQLTVFESLESISAADRAGMYVAANSGGKVYLYDAQGVPQKVHEAAGLTEAQIAKVKEAAAAAKLRLPEVGAVQHAGDEKVPGESFNTYGYALMLKPGSSQESVSGAARILNEELAKRGFAVEVQPRFAKSAENPPYATFSIITKAEAAAYIAGALKIEAKDALVIGDAMFIPRDAKQSGWLSKLGERLSGRPQAKTGNETDRNMAKNLPGVLALGVGAAMDPRTQNGWALAGRGPDVTQKVLESVASKARRGPGETSSKTETILHLGLIGLVLGMAAIGWYAFAHAIADVVRAGEDAVRQWHQSPMGQDGLFLLGATTLGMAGMIGSPRSILSNPNATFPRALKTAVELAAKRGVAAEEVRFVEATASMPVSDGKHWHFTFAIPGALIYADFSTFMGGAQDFRSSVYEGAAPAPGLEAHFLDADKFASVVGLDAEHALTALRDKLPGFGGGASVSLAARPAADGNGAQMTYKFYDDHGSEGTVGANGAFVRVDKVSAKAEKLAPKVPAGLKHAVEPNELYALALENITATAAERGVTSDKIRFLSAVHEARYFNGAWVGDEWRFHFGFGGENGGFQYMVPARRTMITETMMDAFAPKLVGTVTPARLAEGVAASLFDRAVLVTPEAALASVDGVTRVSLLPRVEPRSGDKDLWYSLQDASNELAAVNARTGEIRKAPPAASGASLKSFLIWLGLVAFVGALYSSLFWAGSHAPAAVPQGLPEGYNGVAPSINDVFRGMGGMLGLGAAAGTLRAAKKIKLTDDEIRASASSVISYKGRPWSQTEYNMGYYNTLESLKTRGATKVQLALYEKLCADAPVKGGSFNPWSGD